MRRRALAAGTVNIHSPSPSTMLTVRPTFPVLVLLVLSGTAQAGATVEFGLGGGVAYRKHDDGSSKTTGAVAAPCMSLGAKLGDRFGVVGRLVMLNKDDDRTNLLFGVSAQYWFVKRWFVAGGVGLAETYFSDPQMIDGELAKGYRGLGFDVRVGATLAGESHRWTLALEATPAIYRDETVIGIALVGGYQYW